MFTKVNEHVNSSAFGRILCSEGNMLVTMFMHCVLSKPEFVRYLIAASFLRRAEGIAFGCIFLHRFSFVELHTGIVLRSLNC